MNKNFGINDILMSSIISFICYIIFLRKIESITQINSIIIPVLIITILIIGVQNLVQVDFKQIGANIQQNNSLLYLIDAIIYSSYNLILIIPVLINLKKFLENKKQIIIISTLVSIILGIIALLTFMLLINVDVNFLEIDMPVIYVIKNKFTNFTYIYGVIILIAIFSTAISVGISFLNNIGKNIKQIPKYALILCTMGVLVSKIGFSNLVKLLFPLFGYLGLIQIYFILKSK